MRFKKKKKKTDKLSCQVSWMGNSLLWYNQQQKTQKWSTNMHNTKK